MMSALFDRIFEFDREETVGQVLFFRLIELVVAYQIIVNVWKWSFYIVELTDVILPLGIANYFDVSMLFGTSFPFINATIITLLLVLGFSRKWNYAYFITIFFFHLQYVARFSQGEISHGSNLAGMILLCIGVSFAFVNQSDKVRKTALGLIFFFAGLGYVSAAICKLIGTGITWPIGEHLQLWIAERYTDKLSQRGAFELSAFQNLLLDNWYLATATLTFGLLSELSGFLLWFRKTRWIQAIILMGMHIGIVFTLNIYFGDYVYLLLLIGFPWDKLFDYLTTRFQVSMSNRGLAWLVR